jgi:hypothetical protein
VKTIEAIFFCILTALVFYLIYMLASWSRGLGLIALLLWFVSAVFFIANLEAQNGRN